MKKSYKCSYYIGKEEVEICVMVLFYYEFTR